MSEPGHTPPGAPFDPALRPLSPVRFSFTDPVLLDDVERLTLEYGRKTPFELPRGPEPLLRDMLSVTAGLDRPPGLDPVPGATGLEAALPGQGRLELPRFDAAPAESVAGSLRPPASAGEGPVPGRPGTGYSLSTQVERFEVMGEFVVKNWNTFHLPENPVAPTGEPPRLPHLQAGLERARGRAAGAPPGETPRLPRSRQPGSEAKIAPPGARSGVEIPPELSYSTFNFGMGLSLVDPMEDPRSLEEHYRLPDPGLAAGLGLVPGTALDGGGGVDLDVLVPGGTGPATDPLERTWNGIVFDFDRGPHRGPRNGRGEGDGHAQDLRRRIQSRPGPGDLPPARRGTRTPPEHPVRQR